MPFPPEDVVFPKNRIKRVVSVLHDGTRSTPEEFSIALLEFHDGEEAYGIRHDMSWWNEGNPHIGYPTSRGNPCWFILPDIHELRDVLNRVLPEERAE